MLQVSDTNVGIIRIQLKSAVVNRVISLHKSGKLKVTLMICSCSKAKLGRKGVNLSVNNTPHLCDQTKELANSSGFVDDHVQLETWSIKATEDSLKL